MKGLAPARGSPKQGARRAAAVQRLGGDTLCVDEGNHFHKWKMARVGDIVLIDHAADDTGPRSINCYFVEVEDAAALGMKSEPSGVAVASVKKIGPQRVARAEGRSRTNCN